MAYSLCPDSRDQHPVSLALYLPQRHQDHHLDRHIAGDLLGGNAGGDHLAGEGTDGVRLRRNGTDLG